MIVIRLLNIQYDLHNPSFNLLASVIVQLWKTACFSFQSASNSPGEKKGEKGRNMFVPIPINPIKVFDNGGLECPKQQFDSQNCEQNQDEFSQLHGNKPESPHA